MSRERHARAALRRRADGESSPVHMPGRVARSTGGADAGAVHSPDRRPSLFRFELGYSGHESDISTHRRGFSDVFRAPRSLGPSRPVRAIPAFRGDVRRVHRSARVGCAAQTGRPASFASAHPDAAAQPNDAAQPWDKPRKRRLSKRRGLPPPPERSQRLIRVADERQGDGCAPFRPSRAQMAERPSRGRPRCARGRNGRLGGCGNRRFRRKGCRQGRRVDRPRRPANNLRTRAPFRLRRRQGQGGRPDRGARGRALCPGLLPSLGSAHRKRPLHRSPFPPLPCDSPSQMTRPFAFSDEGSVRAGLSRRGAPLAAGARSPPQLFAAAALYCHSPPGAKTSSTISSNHPSSRATSRTV